MPATRDRAGQPVALVAAQSVYPGDGQSRQRDPVAAGGGVMAPPKHPAPALCRDTDCPRLACAAYREGRQDGYRDGYDDGRDDGYKAGYDDGYRDGYEAGHREGYEEGHRAGHSEGHREGYREGYADGLAAGSRR